MAHRDTAPATIEPLVEALTRREREVLNHLAQGYSAPEIAEQLTLAISSVKWHIQNVYGKLGVKRKRQALTRAQALGLLAPPEPKPALAPPPHNLPAAVTRFFGRESEISHLTDRLAHERLVTLTGSGGVGKTRLALRVATEVLDDFPNGVWFIEFAPLSASALVPQQVAAALKLRDNPNQSVLETLTAYLRDRHLLLLLDNCEHVLADCAPLADALLRACPRLTLLATSREPLNVAGENLYPVPSLPFPDPHHFSMSESSGDYAALDLLVDRASAVLPGYALTPQNAPHLAHICQRLEGIPLALEMAAAWLRLLNAETLAARLDDAFGLLTGGHRAALPKHQTLRATLDWSYNLLSAPERLLLRRLAVFAGGCTLEAAEAVCGDDAGADQPISPNAVLDLLTQLVNKSLVVAERRQGEETRYRLLEMVRQYAHERLTTGEASEVESIGRKHTAFFRALVKEAEPAWRFYGAEQAAWADRLERDQGNLRAALAWAINRDIELGLRLTTELGEFWFVRAAFGEGRDWLTKALARSADGGDDLKPLRAWALHWLGKFLGGQGEMAAFAIQEESLAMWRELGDARGMAHALVELGTMFSEMGSFWSHLDYPKALSLIEESLRLFRQTEDSDGLCRALALHGFALDEAHGDYEAARASVEESLRLSQRTGNKALAHFAMYIWGTLEASHRHFAAAQSIFEENLRQAQEARDAAPIIWNHDTLGGLMFAQSNYEGAKLFWEKSLRLWRDCGNAFAVARGLVWLTWVGLKQGNLKQALDDCQASLAEAVLISNYNIVATDLKWLAVISARQGQASRAARLVGACTALFARELQKQRIELSLDELLSNWRDGPEQAAILRAFEEGQAMNAEQAVAYALKTEGQQIT
jgi:non-specific serine/threonine protein kinase